MLRATIMSRKKSWELEMVIMVKLMNKMQMMTYGAAMCPY